MEVADCRVILFWKHLLLDSKVSTTGQEQLKRCEPCFTSVLLVTGRVCKIAPPKSWQFY